MKIIIIILVLAIGVIDTLQAQTPFHLQAGRPITVVCDTSESAVVQTALELLNRDCRTVFSSSIVTGTKKGDIIICRFFRQKTCRLKKKSLPLQPI